MVSCPVCAFSLGDPRPSKCPSCGVDFTDVPESYITKGPRRKTGTGVSKPIQILSSICVVALVIMTNLESSYGVAISPTLRLILYGGTLIFFIWVGLLLEKSWREVG